MDIGKIVCLRSEDSRRPRVKYKDINRLYEIMNEQIDANYSRRQLARAFLEATGFSIEK
jgi:hypothetical protein